MNLNEIAEFWSASKMVLADLGRKITSALNSLGKATIIDEEVPCRGDVICVRRGMSSAY